MGKFINPFTDFGFKHIFGREMDKDILIEFLNDLLEGEHTIMDLRIMNNERLPETEQGRKVIFDIHCETDKGERIIIEMQNREQPHFKDRALYYLSHSVVEQGIKGTWDYELAAVYGVFFLNFTLDEENRPNNNRNEGKFRRDIILADRENGQVFNPKFRQIYIELPRFNKEEEECETDFERWIYVLKHMDTLDRMPFKARKAIFERLERIGSMANLTPKQRAQYEAEWKMYNDYYNTLDFAVEKGMKKGMEEGMEKGLQKGLEEGLQKGLQKGKAEGKAAGKGGRAMKAEILFPEVCNLYGDLQNIYYLKRCCPALEIIETDLHSKPRFLTEDVALVYMGSTTEQGLRLAADALRPYAADIAARADAGQLILLTGNAPDVFSAAIESDSADTIEGLDILPGRVRYTMMKRHNSFYLGTFEGMDIVGFKSLFGFHYDAAETEGWFDTVRGVGRTPGSKPEGFCRGGLYATALIGPLLILNPPLCKWLLRQMGAEDTLAFEDAAFASFNKRVAEFREPGRGFQYS